MCPDCASRQLEISPSTSTSTKFRASRPRMRAVSSLTVIERLSGCRLNVSWPIVIPENLLPNRYSSTAAVLLFSATLSLHVGDNKHVAVSNPGCGRGYPSLEWKCKRPIVRGRESPGAPAAPETGGGGARSPFLSRSQRRPHRAGAARIPRDSERSRRHGPYPEERPRAEGALGGARHRNAPPFHRKPRAGGFWKARHPGRNAYRHFLCAL